MSCQGYWDFAIETSKQLLKKSLRRQCREEGVIGVWHEGMKRGKFFNLEMTVVPHYTIVAPALIYAGKMWKVSDSKEA